MGADRRDIELLWLSKQTQPMWGGCIERDTAKDDPDLVGWTNNGVITAVRYPRVGYIVTDKGRQYLARKFPQGAPNHD